MAMPSPHHPAAQNAPHAVPVFDLHVLPELPFAEATLVAHPLLDRPALAPQPTGSRGDEIGTSGPAAGAARLRSRELPASAENRTSAQEATATGVDRHPDERAAAIIGYVDNNLLSNEAFNPERSLGVWIETRRVLAYRLESIDAMIVELNENPALAEGHRSRLEEIRRELPVHMAALRLDEGSSGTDSEE